MSQPPNARSGARSSSSPIAQAQATQGGDAVAASPLNPTTSQEVIEPPIEAPFGDERAWSYAAINVAPQRQGVVLAALQLFSAHLESGIAQCRFALEHPHGLNPNTDQLKEELLSMRTVLARTEILRDELTPPDASHADAEEGAA